MKLIAQDINMSEEDKKRSDYVVCFIVEVFFAKNHENSYTLTVELHFFALFSLVDSY